jgi:uncharacterized protein
MNISDHDLLQLIRTQFALDWDGIHGPRHWARVLDNGVRLAETTGANRRIIELFAILHDSRRLSEGDDPDHGQRAALYARTLAGTAFLLDPAGLELLTHACHSHSDGLLQGDITVLTCWDADRLDLGRVGIKPRAEFLCTAAARDPALLEWAYQRSIREDR